MLDTETAHFTIPHALTAIKTDTPKQELIQKMFIAFHHSRLKVYILIEAFNANMYDLFCWGLRHIPILNLKEFSVIPQDSMFSQAVKDQMDGNRLKAHIYVFEHVYHIIFDASSWKIKATMLLCVENEQLDLLIILCRTLSMRRMHNHWNMFAVAIMDIEICCTNENAKRILQEAFYTMIKHRERLYYSREIIHCATSHSCFVANFMTNFPNESIHIISKDISCLGDILPYLFQKTDGTNLACRVLNVIKDHADFPKYEKQLLHQYFTEIQKSSK